MVATICTMAGTLFLQSSLFPIIALSAALTALIIGVGYMIGAAISNPKVTLWAKTEVVQLFASILVILILMGLVNTFCGLDMKSIYTLFGKTTSPTPCDGGSTVSVFCAGQQYLETTALFTKDLIYVARYHLGGFYMLQMAGLRVCEDIGGGGIARVLICLFGSMIGSGGGGGVSSAPTSGYGTLISGLSVAFNSILISYFSSLNFLFILTYVYSGFPLFFLPLGMFLRALPYLRTFGSLLMSVAIAFVIVYPAILAIFYIDLSSNPSMLIGSDWQNKAGPFMYVGENPDGKVSAWQALWGSGDLSGNYFDQGTGQSCDNGGCEYSMQIIELAGNAFLAAIFVPTLAILAAAASVGYINRFLGEEMDLSRVTQMV